MKSIKDIKREYLVEDTGINSERAEWIGKFTDRINKERIDTPFKPLAPKVIAIKLAGLSNQDLHAFYKICEESNNFSQCFFGLLKPPR